MENKLLLLGLFVVCFTVSAYSQTIISSDYTYKKIFFQTHNIEFNVHLENIDGSHKIHGIVNNVMYHDKKFDEFMEYLEMKFTENLREESFPVIYNDDGTQYFYRSSLDVNYSIIFDIDSYVIFKYNMYFYNSGMAHGNYWLEYFVIDLLEERIVNINELINIIPDDLLMDIIKSEYDIDYFLRDTIWSPDTINFASESVELFWNTYSITPYVSGIIGIKIDQDVSDQYLTTRGKELRKIILEAVMNKNDTLDENTIVDIEFIHEDYERDDLLLIMGIGTLETEMSCTWKISLEELEKQTEITFTELVNNVDIVKLVDNSNYFIDNYFGNRYRNRLFFHSIDYITVNNKKYGDNLNIKRNDWIIILSYKSFETNFNEKIFVLPDYRIVISSNNFEEV